jgi:hypothetical protein
MLHFGVGGKQNSDRISHGSCSSEGTGLNQVTYVTYGGHT